MAPSFYLLQGSCLYFWIKLEACLSSHWAPGKGITSVSSGQISHSTYLESLPKWGLQYLTQQWYLAMHWEVTFTLAQVHSGSFTAPSSPPWRIDHFSATSAFPITRIISLLSSCSWLSFSPFPCIPQKRASDCQWDHELELQLSIVVLHYSAASSCSSSCLPIPKPIIS